MKKLLTITACAFAFALNGVAADEAAPKKDCKCSPCVCEKCDCPKGCSGKKADKKADNSLAGKTCCPKDGGKKKDAPAELVA